MRGAERVDFWRVREGSRVILVLGTGGECEGKVARRTDGALAVKLTRASAACGAKDAVVSIREGDARAVERAERGNNAGKRVAAVGVAAATGAVIANLTPRASLGLAAGGLEAIHILNESLKRRDSTGNRYVIYVSRLETPSP